MERRWYAIYTKPRWEKKLAERLEEKQIEHYLPLVKTLKLWSDRKKWVQEPLFRSYIFVHVNDQEYLSAIQTPGAVKYITFERKPVAIPPIQIEAIKTFIQSGDDLISDSPEMKIGDRVQVIRGSLKGLEGTLVEFHQHHRVRIMIDVIQQSLHIKVPMSQLQVIK
ncbi:UpxY family transcription antiterminator [Bacteroidota bacterium]